MTAHVVPQMDAYRHIESIACECGPIAAGWLVIHNAWDGRAETMGGDDWPALSFVDYRETTQ